jgi:hypothetical protein
MSGSIHTQNRPKPKFYLQKIWPSGHDHSAKSAQILKQNIWVLGGFGCKWSHPMWCLHTQYTYFYKLNVRFRSSEFRVPDLLFSLPPYMYSIRKHLITLQNLSYNSLYWAWLVTYRVLYFVNLGVNPPLKVPTGFKTRPWASKRRWNTLDFVSYLCACLLETRCLLPLPKSQVFGTKIWSRQFLVFFRVQ